MRHAAAFAGEPVRLFDLHPDRLGGHRAAGCLHPQPRVRSPDWSSSTSRCCRAKYRALEAGLGDATIHYAVKANPAPEVVEAVADLGGRFDCASRGEIDLCLGLGIPADRIAFGNTIKRASDIAHAHRMRQAEGGPGPAVRAARHGPGLCAARSGRGGCSGSDGLAARSAGPGHWAAGRAGISREEWIERAIERQLTAPVIRRQADALRQSRRRRELCSPFRLMRSPHAEEARSAVSQQEGVSGALWRPPSRRSLRAAPQDEGRGWKGRCRSAPRRMPSPQPSC